MKFTTTSVVASMLGLFGLLSVAPVSAAEPTSWVQTYMWQREQKIAEHFGGSLSNSLVPPLPPSAKAQSTGVTPYVVGGSQSAAGQFPYVVGILVKTISSNYQAQYCSGILIAEKFVLTAAHCVDFISAGQIQVLTNTQSLASGGVRHDVTKVIIHPSYNPNTFNADIALVKLLVKVTGVTFGEVATPAQDPPAGTQAAVVGWGDTEPDNADPNCCFPTLLRQATMPIVTNQDCNDADSYNGAITANMICAGREAGGKGACAGDAGGPLATQLSGPVPFRRIVGVASASLNYTCGKPEAYSVFTRVAKFKAWIDDALVHQ